MRHATTFTLSALICLLITGCVELELDYTLNPDRSGKVHIDAVLPPMVTVTLKVGEDGEDIGLDERLTKKVKEILRDAKGVTAWKDVSAEYRKNGKIHFTGTAYFEDLNDVDLEGLAQLGPKVESARNGGFTLLLGHDDDEEDEDDEDHPNVKSMSDKELDRHLLKQRVAYQQARGLMRSTLGGMKVASSFRLPGKVAAAKVLQQEDPQTVSIHVDGDKLLKGVEELMAHDDEWFERKLKTGELRELGFSRRHLAKFGWNLDAARAGVAGPAKPQFDYSQEVKSIRESSQPLDEALQPGDDLRVTLQAYDPGGEESKESEENEENEESVIQVEPATPK